MVPGIFTAIIGLVGIGLQEGGGHSKTVEGQGLLYESEKSSESWRWESLPVSVLLGLCQNI